MFDIPRAKHGIAPLNFTYKKKFKSKAGQNGTIVTATELFHNLPVRKNFYKVTI